MGHLTPRVFISAPLYYVYIHFQPQARQARRYGKASFPTVGEFPTPGEASTPLRQGVVAKMDNPEPEARQARRYGKASFPTPGEASTPLRQLFGRFDDEYAITL